MAIIPSGWSSTVVTHSSFIDQVQVRSSLPFSCSGSEIMRIPALPHTIMEKPKSIDGQVQPSTCHATKQLPVVNSMPNTTAFAIGFTEKSFSIDTDMLVSRSPFLARVLARSAAQPGRVLHFPTLDEFSFGLFQHWIYGKSLAGPHSFHSMHHYLGLYCISLSFEIEKLANLTMDLVRSYYRLENKTASPFRLSFIYSNTSRDCPMRRFLVNTAIYRLLVNGQTSQVMKDLVENGGDLASDLMTGAVDAHSLGVPDPRMSRDCLYHEHEHSPFCGNVEGNIIILHSAGHVSNGYILGVEKATV